jgi:DNA polymerase type B, organellar and viral
MGVDGEGAGTDRRGRQRYMYLRAGSHELYTGTHLTTAQCLEFLCNLSAEPILVGFSFGYDVTMILRDLTEPETVHPDRASGRLARLFDDKPIGSGQSRYTYWNGYGIDYLPRNYLRVCRFRRIVVENPATGLPMPKMEQVPGSTRTVWEVFGFFQTSFLKAIDNFGIGAAYREVIAEHKANRASFTRITPGIRDYCGLECLLLAALMERLRVACHAAGIRPAQWAGAGKLAAYLHRAHKTITAAALTAQLEQQKGTVDAALLLQAAQAAYYGGRFEITRVGQLPACWEYDINSAYPNALRSLPCLLHGTWQKAPPLWLRNAPAGALFVADVHFIHPDGRPLYGLPVRGKQGFLSWPREGNGTYWSPELRSAERLGAKLTYQSGWRYVSHCSCRPFDWVDALYAERKRLGRGTAGYPIKLGLNSLYGKLAQRIGNPQYGNFIWAGLVTAFTRAQLNDAIALDPDAIAMLATDAVVSLRPLPLPTGDDLGQWEAQPHERLFIVQPGLYWSGRRKGDKRKTRGGPVSVFARHMHRFEKVWASWCDAHYLMDVVGYPVPVAGKPGRFRRAGMPGVRISLTLFLGLRLAHAQGKPREAGTWYREPRTYSFDWGRKRDMLHVSWDDALCVKTRPLPGGPAVFSVPHGKNQQAVADADALRAKLDEQRDPVNISPPGRD